MGAQSSLDQNGTKVYTKIIRNNLAKIRVIALTCSVNNKHRFSFVNILCLIPSKLLQVRRNYTNVIFPLDNNCASSKKKRDYKTWHSTTWNH